MSIIPQNAENIPIIFDNILYTSLRPWLTTNKPDEKFITLLANVNVIEPLHAQVYEFDFIRHFNNKTRYYHKLVVNETNQYYNQIVTLINADDDERVKKYWVKDTIDKKLRTRIKEVGRLINDNDYSLTYIKPQNNVYGQDADHKTDTYIMQLLKLALVKAYLEIQERYKLYFPDTYFEIEDVYTQLLLEPLQDKYYLKEVPKSIVVNIVEEQPAKYELQEDISSSTHSFSYKNYTRNPDAVKNLHDSLKNYKLIDERSLLSDFKKIFSGKEFEKPVVWTGKISELHYFVKLIHNVNKSVIDLKQHQWEVTCKCFICPDGSLFDRTKLKDQKKPKSTSSIIEKVAAHLV